MLRMEKNSTLTMLIFPAAEEAIHSVAPTGSMEEHQYFFIDIFYNLVDSNLSKVSTVSKANPEFIKPKRQEIHIARTTTNVSMVRIITLRSPCRAQGGAECAYLPPHGNMAGDTRRRSCHSVWRRSLHPLC